MAPTLLDQLRSLSVVDCDTLDVDVAQKLGPFMDCTSNQAIAFAELAKIGSNGIPVHHALIGEAIKLAQAKIATHTDVTMEELAIEIMMVQLSLRFAPYLKGYFHIQTNPKWSYSTQKTIKNAERIVSHFKELSSKVPAFDSKRVCIKIPSTWEGLQACRELEKRGISTLATTVFCMEQADLAAASGCTYIAPYVNELRVHFDPSYTDTNKAFAFCGEAQRYYEFHGCKTKVLPASLTSIEEVMQLAGAHHITVSPPLLAELAVTPAEGWRSRGVVGQTLKEAPVPPSSASKLYDQIIQDEATWRLAFTRSKEGRSEGKIIQAINIFSDMQDQLEAMVRSAEAVGRA